MLAVFIYFQWSCRSEAPVCTVFDSHVQKACQEVAQEGDRSLESCGLRGSRALGGVMVKLGGWLETGEERTLVN